MNDTTDLVVVGSGAAGLAAALAAAGRGEDVVVLEASRRWGGSTAVSGGQVWAPNNHLQAETGFADSEDEALAYCRAAAPGRDPELVETFVRSVPAAIRFVEENSPIRFTVVHGYPDTFAELPGGKPARHLEAQPLTTDGLGAPDELLWPPPYGAAVLTNDEFFEHRMFAGGAPPFELMQRRLAAGEVALGAGLVVGLLRGCRAAGVELVRGCRVRRLIRTDGRITGVEAERDGTPWRLPARRVVLATGGFEHDPDLRSQLLAGPLSHLATPPVQHGDGLRLAADVGAQLSRTGEYWSWPAFQAPDRRWPDDAGTPQAQLVMAERYLPHVIWVNAAGRRFVNEASHNCAVSFAELDANTHRPRNLPAWAIGDAQFRARYSVGGVPPHQPLPDWLPSADSLDKLAALIGIDAAALQHTVARFNAAVDAGRDDDFRRGETAYERAFGDATAPHRNLGTVSEPPFFALPVHASAVGTKGGARTDHRARVLDWTGQPIPGLYAAGNAAAAVFGPGTIAGGITIASALTWGWIAGSDAP
ncbi:FAD-dependent oxidoreductase [Amycolatopsis sp. NPDC005232]|uniref:FAD-dependent oxidoreductase n=1 Tax=Amycolatopsis sp. NPDC005232 TaxID=3157027 RepID=UPI0033A9C5C3